MILLLLGKGKALLVGLTQAKTFLSMAIALGGLHLVLRMEVRAGADRCRSTSTRWGTSSALRRYGIPATAPMFIPGFGALVRLKQNPATVAEDARTGLAGPVWGAAAAIAALALGAASPQPASVRHRAARRLDQPLQPDSCLAARRRARVRGAVARPAGRRRGRALGAGALARRRPALSSWRSRRPSAPRARGTRRRSATARCWRPTWRWRSGSPR